MAGGPPCRGLPPVIRPEPTGSNTVTWGKYVEVGYLREYRQRKVSLQHLRPVIDRLREAFGVPYPLAHFKPFVGPGRRLVLEIEQEIGLSADLRMVVDAGSGQLLLTNPPRRSSNTSSSQPTGTNGRNGSTLRGNHRRWSSTLTSPSERRP
ncbi:MAG: hypothetical protein ACRD0K_25725 [Egibacteraceae bacterium]